MSTATDRPQQQPVNIAVFNPNTSVAMTAIIAASAHQAVRQATRLEVTQPAAGVASIEGYADGVRAAFELLALQQRIAADGYLIACADDTGVHALREQTTAPVLGIGEAALHAASMLSARFAVLTPMQRSVTILQNNAHEYGFASRLTGVHALNQPVLSLADSYPAILARARQILQEDHAECLVLGCAGFTEWQPHLQRDLGCPVIDGVRCGIKWLEGLCDLGLTTSKRVTYAFPEVK